MAKRVLLKAAALGLGSVMAIGCATEVDTHESSELAATAATASTAAYCAAIRTVRLSRGIIEADQDGVWSPGETAVLSLLVTNGGEADTTEALTAYPGVRLTFDPPVISIVTSPGDVFTMTGTLQPGTPQPARVRVRANAGVAPGTTVTISAAMADNVFPFDHCAFDGPATTFSATIGSPAGP